MSEHGDEGSGGIARGIVKAIMIGFPLAIVGLTVAVWLITDLDWWDSFATAIMPGILLGGFAGGFAGVALNME